MLRTGWLVGLLAALWAGACSDSNNGGNADAGGAGGWAVSAGGAEEEEGTDVAMDSAGNSLVTGYFNGTMAWDATTLPSAGGEDIFLAKLDGQGKVLWALSGGGSGDDRGYRVAVDGAGNTYLTGSFFGTATLGGTSLVSSGELDIFVARFDGAGKLDWAVSAGGRGQDRRQGIAVDGAGNALVAGPCSATVTFGTAALTSRGGQDIFVLRLDSAGKPTWAVGGGGADTDWAADTAADGAGNAYLTGSFKGAASFGSASLSSRGKEDLFVARVDSSGSYAWAVSAGADSMDIGHAIDVDSAGNSVIAGKFYGSVDFGAVKLVSVGLADIFVARYDNAGKVKWAVSAGGTGLEQGDGVALDSKGQSHVVGWLDGFRGKVTLGDRTFTPLGGTWDIFSATLDSTGKVIHAVQAGGKGFDYGNAVAVDGSGQSSVVGRFSGTASFGGHTFTARGKRDVYVWRPQ